VSVGTGVEVDQSLRAVFTGRRGRLLLGLLLAEFAAAIQIVAYTTVLPVATADLHGTRLYGATLAAGSLSTVAILAVGRGPFQKLSARATLFGATALYIVGILVSAVAPAMIWVLVGSVLRGVASGVLAAFGLTAIGALYPDELRARVLGLFAVAWLLPSLAGPPLNAIATVAFGWRWAFAWPVAVVLVARLLVGRDADLVPWQVTNHRPPRAEAAVVLSGLVAASAAPALPGWWGVPLFTAGLLASGVAGARMLRAAAPGEVRRYRTLLAFFEVCICCFAAFGLLSLLVIVGLGHGVVAGSVTLGASFVTWSLAGFRPTGLDGLVRDSATTGSAMVAGSVLAAALPLTGVVSGWAAVAMAIAASAVLGFGMGFAYPRLSGQAMDDLATERVGDIATTVAFAEMGATAIGYLLGGGIYSLASHLGATPATAIGLPLVLAAAVGALGTAVSARRQPALV
jgi:MFS family permease